MITSLAFNKILQPWLAGSKIIDKRAHRAPVASFIHSTPNKQLASNVGAAKHRGSILASHHAAQGSILSMSENFSLECFDIAGVH